MAADASKGGTFRMIEGGQLVRGTVELKNAKPVTIQRWFGWDEEPEVVVEDNMIVINRPEEETVILVLQ